MCCWCLLLDCLGCVKTLTLRLCSLSWLQAAHLVQQRVCLRQEGLVTTRGGSCGCSNGLHVAAKPGLFPQQPACRQTCLSNLFTWTGSGATEPRVPRPVRSEDLALETNMPGHPRLILLLAKAATTAATTCRTSKVVKHLVVSVVT